MKRGIRLIFTLILLAATAGCMRFGPDFRGPELGFSVPAAYQNDSAAPLSAVPEWACFWWKTFQDPSIDDLVENTLAGNPDIQKSAAVILEQKARLIQTRSSRFPALNLGGEAARNQATLSSATAAMSPTGELVFNPASTRTTTNSYVLSLPATFELDLWGRLSRAGEAARADLLAAEENRRTVIQSILAEVVSLYLEMESLERRIALNAQRIANLEMGLNLVEKRYRAGLTGALEVRQARRTLSQAISLQPSLYQALGTSQTRLAVLTGDYPEIQSPRVQPEDYYRRLEPIPVGLPSELLLRRPDIRAAEAALIAQNARIGEAKALRFPSITLTGTFGYSSRELDNLVSPASELWEIAAGIFQPVFDAGKRKAGQEIAEARYLQGATDYAKTVLNAFAEIENALMTRKQQIERRESLIAFLTEARATQEMAQLRYERGLVDYLTVLDAILARFQAEEDLIQSDLALMQNRVTLCRALGGGWPDFKQENEALALYE
ncbi:MAG: efflux transporter outer membrane subunit [Desulfobacterales bacterium]